MSHDARCTVVEAHSDPDCIIPGRMKRTELVQDAEDAAIVAQALMQRRRRTVELITLHSARSWDPASVAIIKSHQDDLRRIDRMTDAIAAGLGL